MGPSVLTIGLPLDHPSMSSMPGTKIDLEVLRQKIAKSEADIKADGYDLKMLSTSPDDSRDVLIDALKERAWDGIMVGGGVRFNPVQTAWFEEIINAIRIHAPNAKFIFNSSPDSLHAAMKRALPK